MADRTAEEKAALKKKRVFKKFSYKGVDLDQLLKMSHQELMDMLPCRIRRRFERNFKRQHRSFMKRLSRAKREAPVGEKPKLVRTHLRDMPILPDMVGSMVGVYNGKHFTTVEIKPEMIGKYLGEFSITYKPITHGRPGVGSTNSSRFIPLK